MFRATGMASSGIDILQCSSGGFNGYIFAVVLDC